MKPCPFCGDFNIKTRVHRSGMTQVKCPGCGMRGPTTETGDDLGATEAWDELPRRPEDVLSEEAERARELEVAIQELRAPKFDRPQEHMQREFICCGASLILCPATCPRGTSRLVAMEPGVCFIDHRKQVVDKEINVWAKA